MEDLQIKRTKNVDEKFCSECGEIIRLKAEICPKCGVRQLPVIDPVDSYDSKNKKLGEKFLISTGATFLIVLVITLSATPQNAWMNGFIGSGLFAFFSGAIAMAIPTKRKIVYLPISISIILFTAMVIGLSLK